MKRIKDFVTSAKNALWEINLYDKPFHIKWPTALLRLIVAVVRDVREGDLLRLQARSLAYTTLLSLAPLLALCFSVLKGFGVHNQIEPFLMEMLAPLGDQGAEIATRIVGFVANVKVSVLGAVGFAALVFSVIALMSAIEKAFNNIWRIQKTRPLILRVRNYFSVLLIGPLLMFLSVGMTTSLRHSVWLESMFGRDIVTGAFEIIAVIVAWLLFAVAFAALYMFMPYTRVRFMPAFIAGMVTGVLWKTLGWLFGAFVAGSANYAAIYSAFAALILFMIWMYIGWLVVLIGSSICYYLQHPSNQSLARKSRNLSLRVQEKIALQVCAEIGGAFYKGHDPLDTPRLARRMYIPAAAIEDVVEALLRTGILATTGPQGVQIIPGCPFDVTTVDEMLGALRAADETGNLKARHVTVSASVSTILKETEAVLHATLGKTSLKQLAAGSIAA